VVKPVNESNYEEEVPFLLTGRCDVSLENEDISKRRYPCERAASLGQLHMFSVSVPGAGGTTAPGGRQAGRNPGLGAAECPWPSGTRVIHRTACHAGVTGFCGERV